MSAGNTSGSCPLSRQARAGEEGRRGEIKAGRHQIAMIVLSARLSVRQDCRSPAHRARRSSPRCAGDRSDAPPRSAAHCCGGEIPATARARCRTACRRRRSASPLCRDRARSGSPRFRAARLDDDLQRQTRARPPPARAPVAADHPDGRPAR